MALTLCMAGHVDHGKSTLLGRLLNDLDLLPDGKVASLEAASAARGVPLEWSFVLDAFQVERDQAITLDITHVRVRSQKREFAIVDAPGHRDLMRNLVTGAAEASAVLLVVDAQAGVEMQTRGHLALLRVLGIPEVIVAVNKMDLVGWSEARFDAVRDELRAAMHALGLKATAIVPVAARDGANLVQPWPDAPWWRGGTIVDAIDALAEDDALEAAARGPLRLPVQNVYRQGTQRLVAGQLTAGRIRAHDEVLLLPANRLTRVTSLEGWPDAPSALAAGDNAAVTIADPFVIRRGDLLCDPASPPKMTTVFDADLFWLGRGELDIGRRLVLRFGPRETMVRVAAIHHVLDDTTLAAVGRDAVPESGVARVTLRADVPVPVDSAETAAPAARFVLVDGGLIVGGGVADATQYPDQRARRAPAASNLVAVDHDVRAAERARRAGHQGAVVWLTGLSGAGKSTLGIALERRLFDLGWFVYTLDGDNVRSGLNGDLGFSPDDRQENIRRVGEVAALFADAGAVCITAFISPYRDDRSRARASAGKRLFLEIHVDTDLATCEARDPKGFYRRARAGEMKDFTGVDSPYEAPDAADLVLKTAGRAIDECVDELTAFVVGRCSAT
ncbi:MAG: adenylyl-sulfate kinase [Proteobacteria bacterium]|nr:adenylyl-sulfate kinase [Pseudomonadota bacterium]